MASVDGAAVAAGGREEAATQDDVDELREHLDEMNKTNALLEMENEVFEAYLLRHNQVRPSRSRVVAAQLPQTTFCCSKLTTKQRRRRRTPAADDADAGVEGKNLKTLLIFERVRLQCSYKQLA